MNPAPGELDEVLDPSWLSRALDRRFPGCEVSGTEIVEIQQTIATKVRFKVDYREQGNPAAPTHLCVKGYFHDEGRRRAGAGVAETSFYREYGGTGLRLRVASCVYTGVDERSGLAMVIMEDLVHLGAHFLTALSPYSAGQAAATLDQLALLHAATWASPVLNASWLAPKFKLLADAVPASRLDELMHGARADGLPEEIRDGERIHAGLLALVERSTEEPHCMIHGDAHAGNIFETSSGPGLIDWQLVQRGVWAADVAYHIGAVLNIDDRRRTELDLLRHYLTRLSIYGVDAPTWEEATVQYRRYLAYGLHLWAMTQLVDDAITTQFVQRLGQAVSDNESFQLLAV